jgi:hypothetical protein
MIGGDLRGGTGNMSGRIRSFGTLGNVTVMGSVVGSGPNSGAINSDGNLGLVQINHDIKGGTQAGAGYVSSNFGNVAGVSVGGSLIGTVGNDAIVGCGGTLGPVEIGGDIQGGSGSFSGGIGAGTVTSVTILGSLIGGAGLESAEIKANSIGPVAIGVDQRGGDGRDSGRIRSFGNLGTVTIGGSLIGGKGIGSGRMASDGAMGHIYIFGNLLGGGDSSTGRIESSNTLAGVAIEGSLIGTVSDTGVIFSSGAMGAVVIGADLQGGSGQNAGQIASNSSIARVTVGGSVLGGGGKDSGEIKGLNVGPIWIGGDVHGGNGNDSGRVRSSGTMDSLTIAKSLIGGAGNESGTISSGDQLGILWIVGDVQGGSVSGTASLDSSGYVEGKRIASILIGGSVISGTNTGTGKLTKSGSIRAQDDLGPITVQGSLVGNSTNPVIISARGEAKPTGREDIAIRSLTVNQDVTYALVLGGYDVNGKGVNADAQVGDVLVNGDWQASSLATGVAPGPDGFFGTDDNAKLSGSGVKDDPAVISTIRSVTIGGQVSGSGSETDHYGFVAEWVVAFKMGGVDIPLMDGPHNDNVPLTPDGDVTIFEVADTSPAVVIDVVFALPASGDSLSKVQSVATAMGEPRLLSSDTTFPVDPTPEPLPATPVSLSL